MTEENHGINLTFDAADEYRPEAPPPPEIPAWKNAAHGLESTLQLPEIFPELWN